MLENQEIEKLSNKILDLIIRRVGIEKKYYRNSDLKKKFGISSNTIIKYRQEGVIPFTLLGEIYLYPSHEIEEILIKNSSSK